MRLYTIIALLSMMGMGYGTLMAQNTIEGTIFRDFAADGELTSADDVQQAVGVMLYDDSGTMQGMWDQDDQMLETDISGGRGKCSFDVGQGTFHVRLDENDLPNNASYTTEETLSITFNSNGDIEGVVILDQPENGNATVRDDDRIQYIPNDDFFGMDTITYYVYDRLEFRDTAMVYITVLEDTTDNGGGGNGGGGNDTTNVKDCCCNYSPIAQDDHMRFRPDMTNTYMPMLNDTDPNPNDNMMLTEIVLQPEFGQAFIVSDTLIEYRPAQGSSQEDVLAYRICDDSTACSVAYIYLRPRTVSGIVEQEEIGMINVYPNPANQSFTISTPVPAEVSLSIQDGKTLITQFVDSEFVMDTSEFAAGVYFVKFRHNGRIIKLEQLIIER